MKLVLLLKYPLTLPLFFPIKVMVYKKILFRKKEFFFLYLQTMEILLNYMLYTHYVTCNLSTRNKGGNDI